MAASPSMRVLRGRRDDRRRTAGGTHRLLYPLDVVYAQAGIAAPRAARIDPEDIPPPYRSLLVHGRAMTFMLEQHFGGRVAMRVLSSFRRGRWFYRRLLLVQEYSGRPVEMGGAEMMGVFWMREPLTLYGRQTRMTLDDRKIGDIVEILPRV